MSGEIGQLRWRCRRGMRELDVLLASYVEHEYPHAAPAQQEAFSRLLEAQDPQIYAYFMGRESPPDEELRALVERITGAVRNDR